MPTPPNRTPEDPAQGHPSVSAEALSISRFDTPTTARSPDRERTDLPRRLALTAVIALCSTGGFALGGMVGGALGLGTLATSFVGLLGALGLGALPLVAVRLVGSPAPQTDEVALRELLGEGSEACLWTWDPRSDEAWFSSRWGAAFGFTPEASSPVHSWSVRLHPADRGGFEEEVERVLSGESEHFEHVHRLLVRQDRHRWVRVRAAAYRDPEGQVTRLAGSVLDVTERHHAEAKLTHGAFHDPLTELPNRALFLDRVLHAIARARRDTSHRFAVLHMDLDRFAMVNDSLGHRQGDQLLIQLSRRLLACVRPGDTVARLAGDEFTLLLEPLENREQAEEVADRLSEALRPPFEVGGRSFVLTASFGIAMSGSNYVSAGEILRDADTAKNEAKSDGTGSTRLFDSQMHRDLLETVEMEGMLREALEQKHLRVEYQPIVDARTLVVTGYEALVRWTHPLRGGMQPSYFVPLAEKNGLIEEIGLYVLRESCEFLATWSDRRSMNVNLSPRQFKSESLVRDVAQVLADTGIEPELLRFELTETSVMDDEERSARIIRELRELGVRLCIDDFGTGYSSLLTLHRFPIDVLKIDKEFVHGMDTESPGIVRTIIDLGRSMGMQTVAEGVETEEQREILRELGCDRLQGFLFSRAVPSAIADDLASNPSWDVRALRDLSAG
ncbi:MAG: EAL domain-containing protein [Deltaproteobacteria bacterium]|nr:EAL domain-containing protein [Deltaproteobacteria bacterium]